MSSEREMTLIEWVEKLPPIHRVRKEFGELQAKCAELEKQIIEIGGYCTNNVKLLTQHQDVLAKAEMWIVAVRDSVLEPISNLDGGTVGAHAEGLGGASVNLLDSIRALKGEGK